MKYNDEHVPKSPKMVQVDPQCEAAKRVTIHGLRDRGLEVSRLLRFPLDCLIQGIECYRFIGFYKLIGFLFFIQ